MKKFSLVVIVIKTFWKEMLFFLKKRKSLYIFAVENRTQILGIDRIVLKNIRVNMEQ